MRTIVAPVMTRWPTSLGAAGAPEVMSARDVIGKASHNSPMIPVRDQQDTGHAQGAPPVGRPPDADPECDHQHRPEREDGGEEGPRGRARRGQLADGLRQRVVTLVQAGRDDIVEDDVERDVQDSAGEQDLREPATGCLCGGPGHSRFLPCHAFSGAMLVSGPVPGEGHARRVGSAHMADPTSSDQPFVMAILVGVATADGSVTGTRISRMPSL